MIRTKLERQANRIEAVLATHHIPGRVSGGTVTPRWVRFHVLPAIGTEISLIKQLGDVLAAALDAPHCRISRRGAAAEVEIPRDDPQPVCLLPLYQQLDNIPPVTAVLGLTDDGTPLLIRLPSPNAAHILVAGATGAGKTTLLRSILLSLALSNDPRTLQVMLIAASHDFAAFERLPHLVRPVIQEVGEATEALQSLIRLMNRRSASLNVPHIVVVIDELADRLPIHRFMTRLLHSAHRAGIHVIAATRPAAHALDTANFPVRLVGKVANATDARIASGWPGTGAERLQGRGQFIAVAEGQVIRLQSAHVSPDEIDQTLDSLLPNCTAPTQRQPQISLGGQHASS